MPNRIMKCGDCKTYTIKNNCPKCGAKTSSPKPAKYSADDRYGQYRRKYKSNMGTKNVWN